MRISSCYFVSNINRGNLKNKFINKTRQSFASNDVFEGTLSAKKIEYNYYKDKLLEENNDETLKRYFEICDKNYDNLSYLEAYILAHKQNMAVNYEVFQKKFYSNETIEYDEKIDEYVAKCRYFGGNEYNDDDILNYLEYKNGCCEEDFEIDKALRYVAFLNGQAVENVYFSMPEALFFTDEEYRISEVNDFCNYLSNHPKAETSFFNELTQGANDLEIYKKQTNDDYIIDVIKTNDCETDNVVCLDSLISPNGIIKRERSEFFDDFSFNSRYLDNYNSISISYSKIEDSQDENYKIDKIIELETDKSGEVKKLICTKKSDVLKGAFDVLNFDLKTYSENIDIVKEIDNGLIPSSYDFKTTKLDNGVLYEANFLNGDIETKIQYKETKNENGFIKNEYLYLILDKDKQKLLDINRSFEMIDENTSKTVLGDYVYYSKFDGNGNVKIIDENGDEIINYQIVSISNDPNYIFEFPSITSNDLSEDEIKKFIRKLPADILTALRASECYFELIDDTTTSYADSVNRVVCTVPSLSVFAHEMVHLLDYGKDDIQKLSTNKELLDLYLQEMNEFEKKYTYKAQKKLIKYYSQNGGNADKKRKYLESENENFTNIGLSELLADAGTLMVTYGNEFSEVCDRLHFAVRYFPKTIAKAINLIEENMYNSQ